MAGMWPFSDGGSDGGGGGGGVRMMADTRHTPAKRGRRAEPSPRAAGAGAGGSGRRLPLARLHLGIGPH
jgi:hypothetical protein